MGHPNKPNPKQSLRRQAHKGWFKVTPFIGVSASKSARREAIEKIYEENRKARELQIVAIQAAAHGATTIVKTKSPLGGSFRKAARFKKLEAEMRKPKSA